MFPNTNHLIASLSPKDQDLLFKKLRLVQLNAGDVLISTRSLKPPATFFVIQGSIALFVSTSKTNIYEGVAVGLAGREGAVGLQVSMGFGASNLHAIVQSQGFAYEIEASVLASMINRRPLLREIFSKYLCNVYQDIAMLAALALSQDVNHRLANWLVLSKAKCESETLNLTQEHIAKMLGVRRASVSVAAQILKDKGYISYARGYIEILDLESLTRVATTRKF